MRNSIGHFSLYGDFEPEIVTAKLGIQPSSITPKGTVFAGAERPSEVADWELYCPDELDMREQVAFLLRELWPVKDALRPLAEQYTADFNISGEGTETMYLQPELLLQLAGLNVNLNCFFTAEQDDAN